MRALTSRNTTFFLSKNSLEIAKLQDFSPLKEPLDATTLMLLKEPLVVSLTDTRGVTFKEYVVQQVSTFQISQKDSISFGSTSLFYFRKIA